MSRLRTLVRLMRELEEGLSVCMRCGLCQAVCPVYRQTGLETDVARGKLALLTGLAEELLKSPEGVRERLERCLLCGACAAACPSGVNVLELFLKARVILAGYSGLSPVKRMIFRGMLANPRVFDLLMSWASRLQRLFVRPADEWLGTSCVRVAPLLGDRHLRRIAETPFHVRPAAKGLPQGASGKTVAFFVGCLIDKVYPEVGERVSQILAHHGVGLRIPSSQACCGIPALSGGDFSAFRKMIRHNLERFRSLEFDFLVTACATCASTIRKLWPLAGEGLSRAERSEVLEIAGKTREVSQFLVDSGLVALPPESAPPDPPLQRVTYHDPCHLKKSLGVSSQPRTLIQATPGVRLEEMAESDWCCGMGGSFGLLHPDLSREIGLRKIRNIRETGCNVVATACPACMLQITDNLSRSGLHIRVRHVVEVYAEGIGDHDDLSEGQTEKGI